MSFLFAPFLSLKMDSEEDIFRFYMETEIREWVQILNNSPQTEAIQLLLTIVILCLNTSYTNIGDLDGAWCTLRQFRERVISERQNGKHFFEIKM